MATAAAAPKNETGTHDTPASPKGILDKRADRKRANIKRGVAKREKKPEFVVNHIEYIILTPALDLVPKGTVRKDSIGTRKAALGRTGRFDNARIYRTGADKVTIQTEGGEEYAFKTSVLERILARTNDLAITREIPNFD